MVKQLHKHIFPTTGAAGALSHAMRAVVEPGKTGFLSADTDELIESCLKIIRDPALREEMSRCCTEKAAKLLDVEKYKQTIWQAYCLKKHGGC